MSKIFKYTLISLKWLAICVVGLLALLIVAIYIPPVQKLVLNTVLDSVNSRGDMHLEVKQARLLFPLKLRIDSASMQSSGMQITASRIRGNLSPLPLFRGALQVNYIGIADANIAIGGSDSALCMRAVLQRAALDDATINLLSKKIHVTSLAGRNGRIMLEIKPDTLPKPQKPSEPTDWAIDLEKVQLDGVYYRMKMAPTIADLQCALPSAMLTDGKISLSDNTVNIDHLEVNRIDALYIAGKPSADASPDSPASPPDTVASVPWLVQAKALRINNSHAIYASAGAVPSANFNPEYIEVSNVNIAVDSLLNRDMEIRVPLTQLSATERCGISLSASGLFEMDSTAMHARNFAINTTASQIGFNAMMGMAAQNPPLAAQLTASIANEDLKRLVPPAAAEIVRLMPPYAPVNIAVDLSGSMNNLQIKNVSAEIPRHISIAAAGNIADYSDLNRATGNITLRGKLTDGNFVKPALLDAKMQRQLNFPPLTLLGRVKLNKGVVDGNLSAVTGEGDVALDAWWNNRESAYNVALDLNRFPMHSILPLSGMRNIDATVEASGKGLDFFSPKTTATVGITLHNAEMKRHTFSNITIDATLADGNALIEAVSTNRRANFKLSANGNIAGNRMDWAFAGDVRNIDLHALGLADTTAEGSVTLAGTALYTPPVVATRRKPGRPMTLKADIDVSNLYWHFPGDAINADSLQLTFFTGDSLTTARLTNHDLSIDLSSPEPLDTITKRLGWTSLALNRDLQRHRLAIDTIQRAMPRFDLNLTAGPNNIISNYLTGSDISFKNLSLSAENRHTFSLSAGMINLVAGKNAVDTLRLEMMQRGSYLLYSSSMNNRPGTMDQFAHVNIGGHVNADRLSVALSQQDIDGHTGYSLGLLAAIRDTSRLQVKFVPYHPIIGAKEWQINRDNFIEYNLATHHIDANINLHNNVSSLHLFTSHNHADSTDRGINIEIRDLQLADWLAINPFAPPVTGNMSADMNINWQKPDLNGSGTVSLHDFNYGKQKVGDFDLALDLATNAAGTVRAKTSLMVNGRKAITATGNLNDSTAANPFMLDFRMIQFPLSTLNPFLPNGTASLTGTLNGNLEITGTMTQPILNGSLNFDSTAVNMTMFGSSLRFSPTPIPVENNIVKFNNFAIMGVNNKPLTINGMANLSDVASPQFDLNMRARNMQIVGSQKKRGSQAYGKAFVDIDADIDGNMQMLNVDAALNLLPSTNVTYVMADAATALQSRSNQDMVHFVNFADTTTQILPDTVAPQQSMMMNIDARITVSNGSVVTVELDPTGSSKVQLQSNGSMNYTQDYMGDQRFTGQVNLTGGFVRYAVPLIGEKSFNFREGSYVEFNRDMLNPNLHISAYDEIRANVAGNGGNSRVVDFNVLLKVDGTLELMDVVFDLECPDDITIANEIKAMSAEQRANQAMNLLLYGSYRSGGTQTITSGNVGSNALYNFLQAQLNTWAASAISGVDLSFGINQYDKTVDGANTTAMSYSYRVSKSLFDNRFKIVVGGNYTTDANADENFAQNLIADISFEYTLNKAGSMYVRLFRHTGYESILEGEITQTGVGFVYKKKISRLIDIFRRQHSEEPSLPLPQAATLPTPNPAPKSPDTEAPDSKAPESKALESESPSR